MPSRPKLILTAPPGVWQRAARFGLPVAHMAYRIGPGGHLMRANLPVSVRGGLMVIDAMGFDGHMDSAHFCQQVMRECHACQFDGILCDFEGQAVPILARMIGDLANLTAKRGWPLYVNEGYARASQRTRVLIPSALSGGSLRQRLSDAATTHGVQRLTLAVSRVAEDFPLPSPDGAGIPLTRAELKARMERRAPSIFFSNELCAHYFTYMLPSGAHFILFDDAASIRKKLEQAAEAGLRDAILAFPEVDDILPAILG